ncbi:HHLA1 protein, partial [Dyaphorophyia castanea]|nr:HHLA1 protein [Platysteira castanea]
IMQGFCWHVAAKMSLGFLCLFLVFSTGKDNVIYYYIFLLITEGQAQQGKLFPSLFLHFSASCIKKENKKEKQVAVLATAELPAKSLDLSAINLTELVNGMLSTALRGTKKLFSLLSVTSYSSFAFHKVSVTIYNISNAKNIDPGKFPMHYCYCLNNVTNDLTDFTALLVDIIGNSTSYLTEIFKSTSILSVRQSNDSDCIYICVMAGQTGKNLSDFLEILEKSPVINYTFSSNTSSDLGKYILGNERKQQQHFVKLHEDPNKTLDSSAEHMWTFKCEHILSDLNLSTQGVDGIFWVYFRYYCPPVCCTCCCHGGTSTRGVCWCPLSVSLASPATRIPLAQKGEEMPTTKFPLWPKTVGAKGLWFPPPQVEAPRPQGTAGPSLSPGGSSALSPAPQPSPGRPTLGYLNVKFSYSLHPLLSYREGKTRSCFPQTLLPLGSSLSFCNEFGCPQAMLREPRVTSPPVTLIVQKINTCVMELCRFFQLCLCVGQRRYSRKEAMRYCVEYYSWFMKNASYVCERVKRVAYSHTLKQKCLKNICTSV